VRSIEPVIDYKHFIPLKLFKPNRDGHNVLGFHIQSAFITGYSGRVAPPFQRFYLGGEQDIRGFDVRTISPIAYLVDTVNFPLINPDDPCVNTGGTCTGVPKDPSNPRRGNITVPIPIQRLVFPGGDTQVVGNLEYRIPIIENHAVIAFFADTGLNGIARSSQLRVNPENLASLNGTLFGCAGIDPSFNCTGGQSIPFSGELKSVPGTNWLPRLSTGAEVQVMMPIINAPFRIYWAYNALRQDRFASNPSQITRSMFPAGGAGDFSYQQALATYGSDYKLLEPRKTFRFTVSTTF
jgi:outer membrane protein insertion porin family